MEFSQTAEIPFSDFYLIEFFKQSLKKLESQIAESQVNLLRELGQYLLKEGNLINGLEKVARQQYTNDLAISLFDVYERLSDLTPDQAYAGLDMAAEDFTNLYALMMEDKDSVAAIQEIVAQFRVEFGEEEKEKQLEEFMEMARPIDADDAKQALKQKPHLSYSEFILEESRRRLKSQWSGEERAEAYSRLFENVADYLKNTSQIPRLAPTARAMFEATRPLVSPPMANVSDFYLDLDRHIPALTRALKQFEEQEPELFERFVQNVDVVGHPGKTVTEEPKAANVPEADNIDDLLQAYFKSEVDDWLGELTAALNKVSAAEYWSLPLKVTKGFKEVSMIHGYKSYEYVAQILIDRFESWMTNGLFAAGLNTRLDALLEDLKQPELLGGQDTASSCVEAVRQHLDALEEIMRTPVVEEKPEETGIEATPVATVDTVPEASTDEVEQPEKTPESPPENAIGEQADDQVETMPFESTLGHDWLKDMIPLLVEARAEDAQSDRRVRHILESCAQNTFLFPVHFTHEFIPRMHRLWERMGKEDQRAADTWQEIWRKLVQASFPEMDWTDLINGLDQLEKESDAFGVEDEQSFAALREVTALQWDRLNTRLKDDWHEDATKSFFRVLHDNLILLEMPQLAQFTATLLEQGDKPLNAEQMDEMVSACRLFMDRLAHASGDASCADIVDVLQEVLEETETASTLSQPETGEETEADIAPQEEAAQKAVTEEAPAESAPQAEEDDDLALFREETQVFLEELRAHAARFEADGEREHLTKMENAAHSIRSAAHMLNFSNVSALAASLESIMEMFGQSDLAYPPNLNEEISAALHMLEQAITNPDTSTVEMCDRLDALLDVVVIGGEEDGHVSELETDQPEEKEEKAHPKLTKTAEEQPLFAEGADEDDELKEIFREESENFIKDIVRANKELQKNPDNLKAAESLGYAAHSLKSAAQMMGFKEISQLTDALEVLTEAIQKGRVKHTVELSDKIQESIDQLNVLSASGEISEAKIGLLITQLDPDMWAVKEDEPDSHEEEADDSRSTEMAGIFYQEASEILEQLNNDLLELEKMPESEMLLGHILRRLHTIKGSAYVSGFKNCGDLAHKLEDFFQVYKEKNVLIKQEMFDPAFNALDLMGALLNAINENGSDRIEGFLKRMAELDNKLFLYQNYDTSARMETPSSAESPTSVAPSEKTPVDEENIIRVSTEYMDKLVDMASELMINQTQLGANLHDLKEVLSEIEGEKKQIRSAENMIDEALTRDPAAAGEQDSAKIQKNVASISSNIKEVVQSVNMIYSDLNKLTEGLEQNISRVASISKLLHADMLKARMVKVDQLFNRYPRAVRDMARKQKKKVNLIIEDNNTEMDRAMVEGLSEPILHIIRNAIDHGLETPAERKKAGKSETGTLVLRAHQDKNQIVIDIEDDGRGINLDAIREKVVERELAPASQVEKLTEAELLDYIFYPEFSTRSDVSESSGRGIGLDAVAHQIQKLKGNIRLNTEAGVGTSFSLRVPLTLVISHALMVKQNRQTIAVPVIAVQETVRFKADEIITDDDKMYLRVRGRLLPYVPLTAVLRFEDDENAVSREELSAIVLFDAGVSMALGVDEIIGRREVVIKSLGSHLKNVDYISGGTILANGEVALILDYARVIRFVENQYFGKPMDRGIQRKFTRHIRTVAAEDKKAAEEKDVEKTESGGGSIDKVRVVKGRKPRILIVDDSNSVRNFVSSILERNGFETIKAVNGEDALEKVKEGSGVDLMITDLEMPKMHGFELISTVRKMDELSGLPIIILTGRAGMKHRQTAAEEGADDFIVKPFKEKDLLAALAKFVKTD
ncbi:MAG: response regulator [Calditrichaeota bacterium]|nr:MAG: response regulator [Calditrichota bacterium]